MKIRNVGVVKQKTPMRMMRESLNPPMTLQAVAAKVRGIAALRGERGKCSFGHLCGVERGSSQGSVRLLALLAEVNGRPRDKVTAAYQAGRMLHQRKQEAKKEALASLEFVEVNAAEPETSSFEFAGEE